jgi:hypothetical protein
MSSAGFDEVTIYTLVQRVSTPSAAEFWYKTQRSAVTVANVRHKVGEARWPAIDKAILKDLEAMTGGGRVEETYTINLGVGIK